MMKMEDGEVSINIKVDATGFDDVIKKLDELIQKLEKVNELTHPDISDELSDKVVRKITEGLQDVE